LRAAAQALQERATLIIDTTQTPFDVLDAETRESIAETHHADKALDEATPAP